jgi:hypothetical protein
VRLIQLFQVENGAYDATFLGDEKNGEMGAEARYGFQGVRSAAEDVSPKRREDLETAPQPLDFMRRGKAKRGKERNEPGAAGGTGSTGARDCPTHRPNSHFTQSQVLRPPRFVWR